MECRERLGRLCGQQQGTSLVEGTVLLDELFQRTALDEVHDIVGRSVLLEDVVDAHHMGCIAHRGDELGLFHKLIPELGYHAQCAYSAYVCHLAVQRVTVAIVGHEKFLDGHAPVQSRLYALVSDAKPALSQHALDGVPALLQR